MIIRRANGPASNCRWAIVMTDSVKNFISILLCLLFSVSSFAQSKSGVSLSGTIRDAQTNDPVPGAAVIIDNSNVWAISDEKGSFTFGALDPGSYDVEISCLGYLSQNMRLSVKNGMVPLDIKLFVSSLALEEVVVTAEMSKENISTTRRIARNALDHLQLSGMSGISALLPGGKTQNPDLTSDKAFMLRSGGSPSGNAAFGTAVEINGVRMGENAGFSALAGSGTRGLSVENIESVEVVTGVPSAEYGDLNSGLVKVNTKKGRTPLNLTFAVNPRTYQVSGSKGIELKSGFLNISGEWARATRNLTSPYTSYTRRGFSADYSNTFNRTLRLEAGVTGNIGGMNSKNDPDLFSDAYSAVRDNLFTPHFKLMWLLQKPWVTNFSFEGSIYYHDNRSHEHVYNSYASSQPAVHSEQEGYHFADKLPLTYYSDPVIDSRELDYAAAVKYDWLHHRGAWKSLLKAGIQWKADGNVGKGEFYVDPSLAANGYRPRPYSDYPYMHDIALYGEEKLTVPLAETSLEMSAGLRFENVFIKGTAYDKLRTLSPRFNARWILSDKFSLRGGWGITSKLPGFFILFPKQEYRDIQTFGFSYGSEGASRYVYYTQPYSLEYNPALKWQSNANAEIGIEADVGGVQLSLVGFKNVTRNPYGYTTTYLPFAYSIMKLPSGISIPEQPEVLLDSGSGVVAIKGADGTWSHTAIKVIDQTFIPSRRQSNGGSVSRSGIELTADFPEIKPLRTRFRLDASYTHTSYTDELLNDYYRTGWSHTSVADRSYQYTGTYATPGTMSNGRRTSEMDANITAITHIPAARLVITCRVEGALLRRSRNLSEYAGKPYAFTVNAGSDAPTGGDIYDGNSHTAIWPVSYTGLDGISHPFTAGEAADPDFSRLILRSGNIYTFALDGYPPYFSANMSVTKEIGDHVSISFFANNFTNSRKFVKSRATGVSAIFTPDFYYGLTCRFKF